MLLVATNCFILNILGPQIIITTTLPIFEDNGNALVEWVQPGDIWAYGMDIWACCAKLLQPEQRQVTNEDANSTGLIPKNRCLIDARNGHIRTIFKPFADNCNIQNSSHVDE